MSRPARPCDVRLPLGLIVIWTSCGCMGLVNAGCAATGQHVTARYIGQADWTYDFGGIVRGDVSRKELALVFTGGERGEGTRFILDTLRAAGSKGSFFLTGDYLAVDAHRPLVRRMVAEGHYVGPHSQSHLLYCPWEDRDRSLVTRGEFERDLRANLSALRRLGVPEDARPVFFVPPYEWYNTDQVAWARDMGVVLVNFTPGSGSNRDYIPKGNAGFVTSEQILRDILEYEDRAPHGLNGFLLLLHVGSQRTDKMHRHLPALIEELSRRGYRFRRVDELLRPSHGGT